MDETIAGQLRREMVCEGLLECFFGLNSIDGECYRLVTESDEPLTIDEVAEGVDRDRSTAYRSLRRLLETGLVQKRQVGHEDGGYHHVYSPTDPTEVATELQRTLDGWYAKMGRLIHEFRNEHRDRIRNPRAGGS